MQRIKHILALFALLVVAHAVQASNMSSVDATRIVAASDRARGGGYNGIEWNLDITGQDDGSPIVKRTYFVRASDDDSIAEATYPPRDSGSRLLQNGRSMWFGKPSLTKPVSISARQKMVGLASNGDIASTNYAKDYDATILRTEAVDGENTYVINLVAKSKFVTYDRIVYYVSVSRLVPVKAEFYTVSGKLFKTASFEMDNRVNFDGKVQPFVSKMAIQDAIEKANYSILEYRDIKTRKFDADTFSIDALNRP